MASQQPESRLVNQIKSTLKMRHGGFWIKVHGGMYQQNGIPDLLGCVRGHYVALEVKVPERADRVTKLQEQTIREIEDAGGVARVVTSIEEAEQVMDDLYELIRKDDIGRVDTKGECPNCGRPFSEFGSAPRDDFRLCLICFNSSNE